MTVANMGVLYLAVLVLCASQAIAIQHKRNLIWAQTPILRLTVSRLVGIEGDPETWVPSKKPNVKHISAPSYGWEFRGLGFSYQQQMVIWSENMNKKIQVLYLNGSTETVDIFTGTSSEVNGIVVDWLSRNVYWTDALYNWIIMAPLRPYAASSRVYKIIAQTGLDNPHGLAVHPAKNWLFVSDWGARPKIEQMDLLGNSRHTLVDSNLVTPYGLALDLATDVLYWVDAARFVVERLNLRSGIREVIRTDPGTKYYGLALSNNYIFVTEQTQGLLKVISQNSSQEPISFTLGNMPFSIIMYDEDQQPGDTEQCASYGCEQLCVVDDVVGPTCLCGEGFDLKDDNKTCYAGKQMTHPSHLYAIGVAICLYPANIADMSLDNVSLSSQCFLSDRYGYLGLAFDARENMLYYSGNLSNAVSRIPLETGAKGTIVASGTGTVKGLALDWVNGNLYWTDSTNAYIKMSRKDGRYQRILLEDDVNNPLGIAVHPGRGKIYWTDIGHQPDVMPKIESANMDGSGREIIVEDNIGQPNHIIVNYETDKLYWADSTMYHIREYDLETRAMKVFFSQPKTKFYGLSLYKDFILWTDTEDSNGIHIARLDTQRKVRGIIHPNYGLAADLITFDTLLQPDLVSSCNNSGCSQLCLPRGADNFTCACGLGFEPQDTQCVVGSMSDDYFILASDAYQRNLYHIDAKNGAISALSSGEQHEPIAIDFQTDPDRLVYWSDNTAHVLRRKAINAALEAETFYVLSQDSVVDGLAVDSQNHLLFYTDTGHNVICVVTTNVYPARHAVLVRDGHDEPRDIVVSPADGKLYWTDWGVNASIKMASMTGEDVKTVVSFNNSAWPNGLAIDIKGQALYWADAKNNEVSMYMLSTRTQRLLLKEPDAHYFALFVMGDFLYITDWKRRFVSRMHKLGGELMQFGEASFTKLYGISGYNSSDALPGGRGICAGPNKCDNVSICLPQSAANYLCVCIDGYERQGARCVKVPAITTTSSINLTTTTTAIVNSTTTTTTTVTTRRPETSAAATTAPSVNNFTSSSSMTLFPSSPPDNYTATTVITTTDTDYHVTDTSSKMTSSTESANKSGGETVDTGATKSKPGTSDSGMDSATWTGLIVAACVVVFALIITAVISIYFYFRRRKDYRVPHKRLQEDGQKVTYARHNSSDNVHIDDGFENPTYDVTIAMLRHAASSDTQSSE